MTNVPKPNTVPMYHILFICRCLIDAQILLLHISKSNLKIKRLALKKSTGQFVIFQEQKEKSSCYVNIWAALVVSGKHIS